MIIEITAFFVSYHFKVFHNAMKFLILFFIFLHLKISFHYR